MMRWIIPLLKRTEVVAVVLAGIVGALVTIAGGVKEIRDKVFPAPAPADPALATSCFESHHLTPNLMPHYLLNSVGSKSFPYWIRFVGENKCDEELFLSFSFREGRNVLLNPDPQSQPLTLDRRKPFDKVLKPTFDLATLNASTLMMSWTVTDEEGRIFKQGTIETEIVPPNTIAWDLKKPEPDGMEPVGMDYLMATFAAWTEKPSRVVAGVAERCRGKGGNKRIGEAAIRACHDQLFRGRERVSVIAQPIRFPAADRQLIRPPAQAIQDRSATSLEAALLLAGVSQAGHEAGIDSDLRMLVVPSGAGQKKDVFLAWQSEGGEWRAIDMRFAGTLAFETNAARTSERVNRLLAEDAQLREALQQRGAYFGSTTGVAGVDFGRAAIANGIQPALNI
jgi:hypothetical protein